MRTYIKHNQIDYAGSSSVLPSRVANNLRQPKTLFDNIHYILDKLARFLRQLNQQNRHSSYNEWLDSSYFYVSSIQSDQSNCRELNPILFKNCGCLLQVMDANLDDNIKLESGMENVSDTFGILKKTDGQENTHEGFRDIERLSSINVQPRAAAENLLVNQQTDRRLIIQAQNGSASAKVNCQVNEVSSTSNHKFDKPSRVRQPLNKARNANIGPNARNRAVQKNYEGRKQKNLRSVPLRKSTERRAKRNVNYADNIFERLKHLL